MTKKERKKDEAWLQLKIREKGGGVATVVEKGEKRSRRNY